MNPTNPYDTIQQLREHVAAQAAVIEKLREALDELVDLVQDIRAEEYKPDSFTCQPALAALSIPTDSTQILDEVRRAERERIIAIAEAKGWAMRNEDPFEDAVREVCAIREME